VSTIWAGEVLLRCGVMYGGAHLKLQALVEMTVVKRESGRARKARLLVEAYIDRVI
jgi:hypothetical protein